MTEYDLIDLIVLSNEDIKLSTFKDGAKILFMFARLMKATQPLRFFGLIAAFLFGSSVIFMTLPLYEFSQQGL